MPPERFKHAVDDGAPAPLESSGERFVPEFDARKPAAAGHLARYAWASRWLRAGDHVLDLACGSGYGTALLGQSCASVLGVDRSAPAIEYARRTYPSVPFTRADFFGRLPSSPLVDVVVSFETIEHIPAPLPDVLLRLVSAARRAVIGSVPYSESPGNPFHCHFWLTPEALSPLAEHGEVTFYYQSHDGHVSSKPRVATQNLLFVLQRYTAGHGSSGEARSTCLRQAGQQPLVAVLVAGVTDALRLAAALDTFIAQTRPDWEALVSDRELDAEARGVLTRYARRDARIRAIGGTSRSRGSWLERARQQTTAEWILAWPAGAWCQPAGIDALLGALATTADDAVCARMGWFHEPTCTVVLPDEAWSDAVRDAAVRDLVSGPVARPVFAIRRSRLAVIGGFRTEREATPERDALLHVLLTSAPSWMHTVTGVERRDRIDVDRDARPRTRADGGRPSIEPCWQSLRPLPPAATRRALAGGRPVYIWGAGEAGARAAAVHRGLAIRGFIDRDPAKHGTSRFGLPIASPDLIRRRAGGRRPFVIVASMHALEIGRALAHAGDRPGADFSMFDLTCGA